MNSEGLHQMNQQKSNIWGQVNNSTMPEILFNGNYTFRRGENKHEGLEGAYTGVL